MRRYFWMLTILAFCVLTFNATAQVTKGLHFYMPFNEGKGDIAKDVGPKGFEAELHAARNSSQKAKSAARLNSREDLH